MRPSPISLGLASVLEQKGRIDEAVAIYRSLIKSSPDYPDFYLRLGNVLLRQNKIDEAIKNYKKALELNPQLQEAMMNLGQAVVIRAQKEQ